MRASGPGRVTFDSLSTASTRASFGQPGTYVLRLTGSRMERVTGIADSAPRALAPGQCVGTIVELGPEEFWAGIHRYLTDHAYGVTAQFTVDQHLLAGSSQTFSSNPLAAGATGKVWYGGGHVRLVVKSQLGTTAIAYDGPAAESVDIFNFWIAPEATDIQSARSAAELAQMLALLGVAVGVLGLLAAAALWLTRPRKA